MAPLLMFEYNPNNQTPVINDVPVDAIADQAAPSRPILGRSRKARPNPKKVDTPFTIAVTFE
jgi:hypothetical protein